MHSLPGGDRRRSFRLQTLRNLQNRVWYYAKVALIPISLIAAIFSAAIGLFSVASSISQYAPEPAIQISSVNVTDAGADLTLLNYGTAPAQISVLVVESSMSLADGREDAYSGTLYPQGTPIIKPGDVETVRFSFGNFAGSGLWRSETGRRDSSEGSRSFTLNARCEVELWHSTPHKRRFIAGEVDLQLCYVLEDAASQWYARHQPELTKSAPR